MEHSHLRKASVAATIVAASVGATVGAIALLFRAEGHQAEALVGHRLGDNGPDADAVYNPEWGNPVHLVMAGDSVAASLGASTSENTLGAILATFLSGHTHRAVELHTIAVVGARTSGVAAQLDVLEQLGFAPDITVLIVGGNDLTGHVSLSESVSELRRVIGRLCALGSEVVVGTCPDFDTLPSLPKPLREFGGQMSRRLASAQFKTAVAAGARPVLLGKAVRQLFLTNPTYMFAIDGYHPSSLGYQSASLALLPALQEAFNSAHLPKRSPTSSVPPLRTGTD